MPRERCFGLRGRAAFVLGGSAFVRGKSFKDRLCSVRSTVSAVFGFSKNPPPSALCVRENPSLAEEADKEPEAVLDWSQDPLARRIARFFIPTVH